MTERDLSGWVILSSGGSRYIGRVVPPAPGDDGAITLSPAYEYLAAWQISPQGVARPRHILPLEMFPEADTIECAQHESRIPLDSLSAWTRKYISQLIDVAEEMRKQVGAQQAGISLVKEMPKLAPINGGRA